MHDVNLDALEARLDAIEALQDRQDDALDAIDRALDALFPPPPGKPSPTVSGRRHLWLVTSEAA